MALLVSLECKYELEESTVESRNSSEIDDNNQSEQSTDPGPLPYQGLSPD